MANTHVVTWGTYPPPPGACEETHNINTCFLDLSQWGRLPGDERDTGEKRRGRVSPLSYQTMLVARPLSVPTDVIQETGNYSRSHGLHIQILRSAVKLTNMADKNV